MTDREAFIRSIRRNPDDPVARMTFADWLYEHGEEEWSELIHLGLKAVELEGKPKSPDRDFRWTRITDRSNQLIRPMLDGKGNGDFALEMGFVTEWRPKTWEWFLSFYPEIMEWDMFLSKRIRLPSCEPYLHFIGRPNWDKLVPGRWVCCHTPDDAIDPTVTVPRLNFRVRSNATAYEIQCKAMRRMFPGNLHRRFPDFGLKKCRSCDGTGGVPYAAPCSTCDSTGIDPASFASQDYPNVPMWS